MARYAALGVALYLVQEKKKTLQEAVSRLAEWRDELSKWDAVTGPAAPEPMRMISSNGPRLGLPDRPVAEVVGKPAADFTLKDVNGKEVSLSSLRGKTVLLDFWATWCEPCRRAMPDIKAAYDAFHAKGLEVVCVDFSESAAVAQKYFEENQYPYFNLIDPGQKTFNNYGGGGIPKTLLIDRDGVVRFFQQGFNTNENFLAEIRKLGL
jgi:peroxiredoxin